MRQRKTLPQRFPPHPEQAMGRALQILSFWLPVVYTCQFAVRGYSSSPKGLGFRTQGSQGSPEVSIREVTSGVKAKTGGIGGEWGRSSQQAHFFPTGRLYAIIICGSLNRLPPLASKWLLGPGQAGSGRRGLSAVFRQVLLLCSLHSRIRVAHPFSQVLPTSVQNCLLP